MSIFIALAVPQGIAWKHGGTATAARLLFAVTQN
jgi:hypothetical protein